MLNNGRLLDWSSLSHKAQSLEYNGKQKTLEPLRFQGFEHSEKDQRLLNWGARRAALRPYFWKRQTWNRCGTRNCGIGNKFNLKFNRKLGYAPTKKMHFTFQKSSASYIQFLLSEDEFDRRYYFWVPADNADILPCRWVPRQRVVDAPHGSNELLPVKRTPKYYKKFLF